MPAEGIHLTSLEEAVAAQAFPPDARRCVARHANAARFGAVLLDLPYFDRYLEEVGRYLMKRAPRPSPWGDDVHERAAVPILVAMLDRARDARSELLAAIALGLASHAAIDRAVHPLVNTLARRHAGGLSHGAAHREVEKFQSICFHEARFGRDRMGTPGIVHLVYVPCVELLARDDAGEAVTASFGAAMASAPSRADLARMARGYEQHAWLLGSPLGGRVASEADKARARPLYLSGAWGSFEASLERAITGSVPVMERAWAVFVASDVEADAARAALLEALPVGTIDGMGDG